MSGFSVEFSVSDLPRPPAIFDPIPGRGDSPPRFTILLPVEQVAQALPAGVSIEQLVRSSIPGFVSAGSQRRPIVTHPENTVPMEVVHDLMWLDAQNRSRNEYLYNKRVQVDVQVMEVEKRYHSPHPDAEVLSARALILKGVRIV